MTAHYRSSGFDRRWRAVAGLVVAFSCVAAVSGAQDADFLLVAATDQALAPVRVKLVDSQDETRAAWEFWTGRLAGKRVVLTRSEGDPLNAVAATTLAIRRFHPKLVVLFGTARPLDPALRPGDVVVSTSFAPFDGMVSPVTALENGSNPLAWEPLPHLAMQRGEVEVPTPSVPAAPAALAVALKLVLPSVHVVPGVLGSANQVNREADRIAWIRTIWHAVSEDGESAHIAACAALLDVPAIGMRAIGDDPAPAGALALKLVENLP